MPLVSMRQLLDHAGREIAPRYADGALGQLAQ
jgi:hypothetical protein